MGEHAGKCVGRRARALLDAFTGANSVFFEDLLGVRDASSLLGSSASSIQTRGGLGRVTTLTEETREYTREGDIKGETVTEEMKKEGFSRANNLFSWEREYQKSRENQRKGTRTKDTKSGEIVPTDTGCLIGSSRSVGLKTGTHTEGTTEPFHSDNILSGIYLVIEISTHSGTGGSPNLPKKDSCRSERRFRLLAGQCVQRTNRRDLLQ